MDTLVLEDVDSVFIRVRCERGTAKELSDCFSFKIPNHKYMSRFRKSRWNGDIKLYNTAKATIYRGLKNYVTKFAADRGYHVENKLSENPIAPLTSEDVDALFSRCVGKASGIPSLHDHAVAVVFRGEIGSPEELEHGAREMDHGTAGDAADFLRAFFAAENHLEVGHGHLAAAAVEVKCGRPEDPGQPSHQRQRQERNQA